MINMIFKPKGSRIWRWKFRQKPTDGKIEDISLGTSEKQVAEKRRAELLRERQFERDGLVLPKSVRNAAQRSLEDHLQDFLGDGQRLGLSEKHLANLEFRVSRLIVDCHWSQAKDVTADSMQNWLRGHSELAPKTANDYLEAVRSFFNWLIKAGRVQINPLLSVEKAKTEGRQTRERRSFTVDEIKTLLAAAGERKAVYLMAVHTGLRRSELAALKWADLRLDEAKPFVLVRASTTKNSKVAPMSLHPEVVAALHELKAGRQPGELVFKRFPRIERFKRDLKKAGIAYTDALGRFADFHSLRKTLCTNLAKAGVPRRTAMSVMRHSDGKLTDKVYTDENLLGVETAIDVLPTFTTEPGTASQGASQGASQIASQIASQKVVIGGHDMSPLVTLPRLNEAGKPVENKGESHGMALAGVGCHEVDEWREWRGSNP